MNDLQSPLTAIPFSLVSAEESPSTCHSETLSRILRDCLAVGPVKLDFQHDGLSVSLRVIEVYRATPGGLTSLSALERQRIRKAWHSPDWREIHLQGQRWILSLKPAVVVRALWTAALEGKPDVDQSHLLRKAESECIRVPDLFKRIPQWDQLIVSIEPGRYRLACADTLKELLEEEHGQDE